MSLRPECLFSNAFITSSITIDDLKTAVKSIADRVLEEGDIIHLFGDEKTISVAKFREKLLDVRQYFRKLVKKVTPSTEAPSAELDDSLDDDKHDTVDDELNDDSLEPIDTPDDHKEAEPEEIDPYSHERKPDYREETKKLIEGASLDVIASNSCCFQKLMSIALNCVRLKARSMI